MKRITIIGGGGSGILLAVNLLKSAGEQSLEINLIEKKARVGRGIAYSTANVARHRMPPECARILDEFPAKNQLEVLKGRLKNIEHIGNDEKFEIWFSANGMPNYCATQAIINCIGSESNFNRAESVLVKNLLSSGLIKTDRLKMGIAATPDDRIIDGGGNVSDKIHTIGTALKGVLWESTAMPEIRAQAARLAADLLN